MGLISRALAAPRGRPRNLQITSSADLAAFLHHGGRTWAGVDVGFEGAMHIAAFFAGVRLISEDIGKLPFPVYTRDSDANRQRASGTPLWSLLHDAPNAWMDSQQFRELGTALAITRGNFVALKNPGRPGAPPVELLPVKPERVQIIQLPDFTLVYRVRMATGEVKDFMARDVFHLRGFSLDGVNGVSIVSYARQTLGLATALERHGATTFGNGAIAGGVYRHPGELSDRAFERLKADLDELKGEGAHGSLILEEGMDWTQTSLSNEDSQFLESRKFEVVEIARWLRIPPHKLADLERGTFSNIEHQSMEYVTDTLMTWASRWERAIKRQVIGLQRSEYAEINFDALLRATTIERAQANRIAVGRPWKTGNEVRREENLPHSDEPSMDTVILPANLNANGDPSLGTLPAAPASS